MSSDADGRVIVCALLTSSVGKALAQARQAKLKPDGKSMTQKDLATAVNAKPQDVSGELMTRQLFRFVQKLIVRSPISRVAVQCRTNNCSPKSSVSSASSCVELRHSSVPLSTDRRRSKDLGGAKKK